MVRETNQDAIYLNREKNLFVVADGMGGHNGGDIASSILVKCIPEYFLRHDHLTPNEVVSESIKFANSVIFQKGCEDSKLKGMGTTAVSCYFEDSHLYIGNVGDSRAYLIQDGRIYQLTIDHSLVHEKLSLSILSGIGSYDRQKAEEDPQKNVLIRTVGFEENISVDVFSYKVSRNDLFVICSDGLHGKVTDDEILNTWMKNTLNYDEVGQELVDSTTQELIDIANQNGGNDNISAVMMYAK
jgi:PPM family protein phosphatase